MEQLTDMTCRVETFSRQRFVELLNEFCDLFNIAKGVTEFYQNVRYESLGIGEVLIDRDNGNGDVEIINRRLIPESGVVIIGKLYMSSDDPPLSMEELKKDHTVLFITHDPTLMRKADRILVVDDGVIVAQGTHKALIKRSKFYRDLQNR